jgi:hypothetical protein
MNSASGIVKPKLQKKKIVVASWEPIPKGVKPKGLSHQKQSDLLLKEHQKQSKSFRTNPQGPKKIWVPKSELVNNAGVPKSKGKAKVMVPR